MAGSSSVGRAKSLEKLLQQKFNSLVRIQSPRFHVILIFLYERDDINHERIELAINIFTDADSEI